MLLPGFTMEYLTGIVAHNHQGQQLTQIEGLGDSINPLVYQLNPDNIDSVSSPGGKDFAKLVGERIRGQLRKVFDDGLRRNPVSDRIGVDRGLVDATEPGEAAVTSFLRLSVTDQK